jgi:hypothetical protein
MCDDSDIMEYDNRTPELMSYVLLKMKQNSVVMEYDNRTPLLSYALPKTKQDNDSID